MKIGLYNPFMSENIGGSERYCLSVAECLLKVGQQVDLVLQNNLVKLPQQKKVLKKKYTQASNLDLSKLQIINGPFGQGTSSWQHWQFTRQYDAFYYLTDGSFFIPGAKLNITQFMIPFKKSDYFNRLKSNFWQIKTANSEFTKKIIEKEWRVKINYVHAGIVDLNLVKPIKKRNIILNVGRFLSSLDNKHCKRQDILMDVFKEMCDRGLKNWKLILVGSLPRGKDNIEYAKKIEEKAENYPIIIKYNIPFRKLQQYYGETKIYWHATGFGLDEDKNPESMEHLGISTIEAMAAGAVPVVINKGGQKEIVSDRKSGLLWETKEELIEKTLKIMRDEVLWGKLSEGAQKRANDFSKENFCKITRKIFNL